jgi:hypothetical protein
MNLEESRVSPLLCGPSLHPLQLLQAAPDPQPEGRGPYDPGNGRRADLLGLGCRGHSRDVTVETGRCLTAFHIDSISAELYVPERTKRVPPTMNVAVEEFI